MAFVMNGFSAVGLTTILTLALSLVVFPGVELLPVQGGRVAVGSGSSPNASCLGCCIPCPTPLGWVPAGPMEDKLQIQVYTDAVAEYNAMLAISSALDLADSPVPASFLPSFSADTRFFVTPQNSAFDMFDVEFNHANTFFGINDQFGNNPAGILFRQGIAHLIYKQAFVASVLGGQASPIDNPVPPAQGITHSGLPSDTNSKGVGPYTINYTAGNGAAGSYNLGGICSWDALQPSGCLSAYHYAADTVDSYGLVTASSSNPDFCDAANHWIAAGLASGKSAVDCHLTGLSPALASGSITFVIRSDNPPRFALGRDLQARMCELINGAGVTSCSQFTSLPLGIPGVVPLVFSTKTVLLTWHMYTGGLQSSAQFDQLYTLYNSRFASSACGGQNAPFATNYIYFCSPDFDHFSNMVENDTASGAIASAQLAMETFGNHVATIPIWSDLSQYPFLKGWTGVNDAKGTGPPNFFTLLNMWNPNPTSACGSGCGGTSGTIRWGFAAGTTSLNPFLATTIQEIRVLSMIYDSLIQTAPYNATTPFGWMANQFTVMPPQTGDPAGTVQDITVSLRNNLFWHDGRQVGSSDVKFSLLAYQQAGNGNAPLLANVIDLTIMNNYSFRVNLNSKSVFGILNVGNVPILPQHVWASDTTTKCSTKGTAACTVNPNLINADPITNHLLIGSGPWVCADLSTGQVGGGCTKTSTGAQGSQLVDAGGEIILQRFGFGVPGYDMVHNYNRDSRAYKNWLWADRQGQSVVNFLDASNFGSCWGKTISSTLNTGCLHWVLPSAMVSCASTAGSCNPGSLTSTALGGDSPNCASPGQSCREDILEVSLLGGFWLQYWTYNVAYIQFFDAQAVPQTLYEGGVIYSGSAPP